MSMRHRLLAATAHFAPPRQNATAPRAGTSPKEVPAESETPPRTPKETQNGKPPAGDDGKDPDNDGDDDQDGQGDDDGDGGEGGNGADDTPSDPEDEDDSTEAVGTDETDETEMRRSRRASRRAVRFARLRERNRCMAILTDRAAAANPQLALHLAFATNLGRKEAIAALKTGGIAARGGLAGRMTGSAAPDVGPGGVSGGDASSPQAIAQRIVAARDATRTPQR